MTAVAEQTPSPQVSDAPNANPPTNWKKLVFDEVRVGWIPTAVFAILSAIAWLAADSLGVDPQRAMETHYEEHTVLFYRVIFSIQIAQMLLIVALCLNVFTRSDSSTRNRAWRWWWTMAYAALLVHLWWSIEGMFDCHDLSFRTSSCRQIFDSRMADLIGNPENHNFGNVERAIEHPILDLFLALVWGFDVFVAWVVTHDNRLLRTFHGIVSVFVFGVFFHATAIAPKATWPARYMGLTMAALVSGCLLYRTVRYEVDHKSLSWGLFVLAFRALNKLPLARWHHLPTWIAVANLVAVRSVMRDKNLHNTSDIRVSNSDGVRDTVPFDVKFLRWRNEEGQYNHVQLNKKSGIWEQIKDGTIKLKDLKAHHFEKPTMGNASSSPNSANSSEFDKSNPGARFGRNIPLDQVEDASKDEVLYEPSARKVSELLLARGDKMTEATTLNLLAAAWIQFQVHDWFNHGDPRPIDEEPLKIKLCPEDNWPAHADGKTLPGDREMHVRRTRRDPTRSPNDGIKPETFVNAETHWWDCSQIYGSGRSAGHKFRTFRDGKLATDPETGLLPRDPNGGEAPALGANWWLGLSLMHNLFTLEHNAICDYLRGHYPNWDDEELYQVARLINIALMAKIHTVEWTRAILAHPILDITMNASWWGLATEQITKNIGRISLGEIFSGIPGSSADNHGADYCLTEEFVSVYRMHPLLPDEILLHSHLETRSDFKRDAHEARKLVFQYDDEAKKDDLILGPQAMPNAMKTASFADIAYTFGVEHPGAITLRNFPNWMRKLPRPEAGRAPKKVGDGDAELIDLATIDIMRDRERGVPRYNKFRKLFHLPRKKTYKEISEDEGIQTALRDVYGVDHKGRDNVDKVDLMVGLFAENPPVEGFGFSDTAFRVFILMASRRIKSDRFLTDSYTPEVYTKEGLDWINNNGMRSVLLRHCPELAQALHNTENAFKPWGRVRQQTEDA